MKRTIKIITPLLLLILFAGCGSLVKLSDTGVLYSNAWKLVKINGQTAVKPANSNDVTLAVVAGVNSFGGNSSCNQYFGNVTVSGDRITFGDLGSTKMACDDMNLEINYFQALRKVDRFTVNNGILYLYSGSQVVLEYQATSLK